MSSGFERLNALSTTEAEAELQVCGGASRWARAMTARRPFRDEEQLFSVAEEVWHTLGPQDWLETFTRHPRIGQRSPEPKAAEQGGLGQGVAHTAGAAREWSSQEQSGVKHASSDVVTLLAEGNRAYQERFGYIFIVCATGKTAEQMLTILDRRLQNEPGAELPIAAEELRQIMRLRLRKLLDARE